MKNNLLFVNHNREIIREFLNAMKEYTLDIDTADTGDEVAAVLKKKKYKVVITGMNMHGFDGSKIIAYLNHYCPQTVCIVYTRRLELAHLKLLVNERKVFRIFQKSADFREEICSAVMEAFEYYDIQEKEHQEKLILEQKIKNAKENLKELEHASLTEEKEKRELVFFLDTMRKTCAETLKSSLTLKERHLLSLYETEVVNQLLKGTCSQETLEEMSRKLYGVCDGNQWQKLQPVIERLRLLL
ncbi:response regulator [Lachnospiraceae bacterium 45-W7]